MNLQSKLLATKKTFLTFTCFLLLLSSKAQVRSLSFTIGPSFPIDKYASKNINSSSSGVAKTGQGASIFYAHPFNKQTGIAVTLQGQRNPLDIKAFKRYLTTREYNNWNVDKASWILGGLRVGGYKEFVSKANSVSFISKLMIGAVYAKSPKLYARSESPTHVAEAKQTSESAIGMSFSLVEGQSINSIKKYFSWEKQNFLLHPN